MTVYTMDEIATASGLSTERLQEIDDDELEVLAESVLLDDVDEPGDRGVSSDVVEDLEALSEEELQVLVEVIVADELGHDLPASFEEIAGDETAEAAAMALATDGGSSRASTGSNAGDVSLTANTRRVATAHGLPTDWHALDGIDLPPALADATLDDRGLAAAINRANGWDRDEGEGVTAHRVGNLRDKGGAGRPGASVEDLAGNDAGRDSDLDAEPPLPVSTVKQYVARHKRETGRDAGLNSSDGFGASLDDLD